MKQAEQQVIDRHSAAAVAEIGQLRARESSAQPVSQIELREAREKGIRSFMRLGYDRKTAEKEVQGRYRG
jgi:hypothetical protein